MKRIIALFLTAILLLSVLGCSTGGNTKAKIQDTLATNKNVSLITWAPDETMVVYVERTESEIIGSDQVYRWKIGAEAGSPVGGVSPTVTGFTWAPDGKHFLVHSESAGQITSRIIAADNWSEDSYIVKSNSLPAWSPDGTQLAYSYDWAFYEEEWAFIEVFELGKTEAAILWRAHGFRYQVDSWDQAGNIGYTETDPQGKVTKKTTRVIRPSLAGVHLGDTRSEVTAALGTEYEEIFSEEIGHFPEQVYRWDYTNGTRIYIGKESGKVIEINATSPEAATNLGAKVGDTTSSVLPLYQGAGYHEPESIHGSTLHGVFRVEGGGAMFFIFADRDTLEIKPDARVERIILTYPEIMDDSF